MILSAKESTMKKLTLVICTVAMLLGLAGTSDALIITTSNDWGTSTGTGDQWSYICQIGEFETFFEFDLSSIPDTATLTSMTFNAYHDPQRTLWRGSDLIGTLGGTGGNAWQMIDVDLSALDWKGENLLTLTLTGPLDGSHLCGVVFMMESGYAAYLDIDYVVTPEPGTMALLGSGLMGLAILGIKKKT
jgi:hypothetical protein